MRFQETNIWVWVQMEAWHGTGSRCLSFAPPIPGCESQIFSVSFAFCVSFLCVVVVFVGVVVVVVGGGGDDCI